MTTEDAVLRLEAEIARLTYALHMLRAHPDFEYATTQCGRKMGPAPDPAGEGWEPNGDDHDSWERFDWHEDHYWRRPRGPRSSD